MSWPVVSPEEVAWIDADMMRELDRQMIDEVGITLLQMMENAGRSLAAVVRSDFDPHRVVVLAGSGGNGGGGLVAARHLANAGVEVRVVTTAARSGFTPAAAHQLAIVEHLGIEVRAVTDDLGLDDTDVVVDAMVGYSLRGTLRGEAAVAGTQTARAPVVVSLDVPSGTSPDGAPIDGGVTAHTTVTLCLPKVGLRARHGVGRLLLADISVPAHLVVDVTGGPAPPFGRGPILEITA